MDGLDDTGPSALRARECVEVDSMINPFVRHFSGMLT